MDLSHIKTEKYSKEVLVGRLGMVRWKAWRTQHPDFFGYGKTEQDAIDDLRFRVQPDWEGELDGVKPRSRNFIGGNMFSREEIISHNRVLFGE